MTISQLKALNEQNGGVFFNRNNMKFMGDTMKNFTIRKGSEANTVIVTRKQARKPYVNLTAWTFSTITGRVIHSANGVF